MVVQLINKERLRSLFLGGALYFHARLIINYDKDVESLRPQRPRCVVMYLDLDIPELPQDCQNYKKRVLCAMEYHTPCIECWRTCHRNIKTQFLFLLSRNGPGTKEDTCSHGVWNGEMLISSNLSHRDDPVSFWRSTFGVPDFGGIYIHWIISRWLRLCSNPSMQWAGGNMVFIVQCPELINVDFSNTWLMPRRDRLCLSVCK